jgi:hypothetical protein
MRLNLTLQFDLVHFIDSIKQIVIGSGSDYQPIPIAVASLSADNDCNQLIGTLLTYIVGLISSCSHLRLRHDIR